MLRRDFLKCSAASAFSLLAGGGLASNLAAAAGAKSPVIQERLEKFITARVATGCPPGVSVVVLQKGRTLCSLCAGRERPDDPQSRAISPVTRFNVGSVTKPVTAALLFKLVESGKLALDEKVARYIPEFAHADVTVQHLLTHTAGFGVNEGVSWPKTPRESDNYWRALYAITTRPHKAGEVRYYWSAGYSILMDLIQRLTGQKIDTLAQEVLFGPLGMKHTTYDVTQVPAADLVLPYTGTGLMEEYRTAPPTGDSGLLSTAEDLARFGHAVLTGKSPAGKSIFTSETVKQMLTECTEGRFNCTPMFFYHGSRKQESCFGECAAPEAVAHPGFTGCLLLLDPPSDTVISMTSNGNRFHDDWVNYAELSDTVLAG